MDCRKHKSRLVINLKSHRSKEKSFPENLECILGTELPKPTNLQAEEDDHQQIECGICYAQFLPTGDFSNLKKTMLQSNNLMIIVH